MRLTLRGDDATRSAVAGFPELPVVSELGDAITTAAPANVSPPVSSWSSGLFCGTEPPPPSLSSAIIWSSFSVGVLVLGAILRHGTSASVAVLRNYMVLLFRRRLGPRGYFAARNLRLRRCPPQLYGPPFPSASWSS